MTALMGLFGQLCYYVDAGGKKKRFSMTASTIISSPGTMMEMDLEVGTCISIFFYRLTNKMHRLLSGLHNIICRTTAFFSPPLISESR